MTAYINEDLKEMSHDNSIFEKLMWSYPVLIVIRVGYGGNIKYENKCPLSVFIFSCQFFFSEEVNHFLTPSIRLNIL